VARLLTGEQGRAYSRIKVTLHADPTGSVAPTLYQWYLTYFCKSAQMIAARRFATRRRCEKLEGVRREQPVA